MDIAERQKPPAGALFLDHVAHFVPDLGAAAQLAEALGFAVTPESAHRAQGKPAGTSNRCLMLEEGYVELLAPTLDTPHAQRVRDRMERYVGVHLCCFGTPAAEAEHARLAAHGFAPDPLVELERPLDDGGAVRFSVVYVPPAKMAEGRIQYVQQLTPEAIWQPRWLAHTNGVAGLRAVYVVAEDPAECAARWARFTGLLPFKADGLVELRTSRGIVAIGDRQAMLRSLGAAPPAPGLAGYALSFRDPAKFLDACRKRNLPVEGCNVLLPPALGGVWRVAQA